MSALLRDGRAPLAALLFITAAGALLRAYHIAYKPLWFDEAVIFWIAQHSIPQLVAENALNNSAPPLFPLLISLVSRASTTEASLRFLPWLAGVLVIPAMYLLARRFLSTGAALIAAFLIAIAPTQVQYSQQLREYSLSVLLTIAIILAFLAFIDGNSWKTAAILAALMVMAIFTQYGLALVILSANIIFLGVLLLSKRFGKRELLLKWAFVQTLVLGSGVAVYLLALRTQMQPGGVASDGHLAFAYWTGSSARSAAEFVYVGARDLIGFTFPGYVFTLLLYAGSIILLLDHSRSLLPFLIAVPIAAAVLASLLRLYPLSGGRQDIFLTPLVFLVAGAVFAYLLRIERKLLLVALFTVLLTWRAIPSLRTYYSVDGEGAVGKLVARVATLALPGDPIYICLPRDPVLRYYLEERYSFPKNPLIEGVRGPGPRDYLDQVDAMLAEYGRAWILTYAGCGDVTPLMEHISQTWDVTLVEKRYPEAQLFYVQ